MRAVFLSPGYPAEMTHFVRGLAEVGVAVYGVGDTPRESLPGHVKPYLADYLTVPRMLDEQDVANRVSDWMRGRTVDRVLTNWEPCVLLACFQEARHFTPATTRRFARIAGRVPLVAALGAGLGGEPAPGVRGAGLADNDALRGEWNVLVVGPHRAAALVARDLGDDGPDGERRFDFVLTHDRALVVEAARALLPWLAPAPFIPPVLARAGMF